jgi:hypothetical protein
MCFAINSVILALAFGLYVGGVLVSFFYTLNLKFAFGWPAFAPEIVSDMIRRLTGKDKR